MARFGTAQTTYDVLCWNCLGEFDAVSAIWCSDDPKNPTKVCPFCFRCFCAASEKYKQEFWRGAPPRLQEEVNTLGRSRDRLGDVLIRMKKITTSQLLDALVLQKDTGQRLGELLVERGLVSANDVQAALLTQGANPLTDATGVAYTPGAAWEGSPDSIVQYVLSLAARKGASDVQMEPKEDGIAVKYRIDDFFFRVDPIPKRLQAEVTASLFRTFGLDPAQAPKPQRSRTTATYNGVAYDLVAQTLPTGHGLSVTVKLINRGTFLKDIPSLGMEMEDRVRVLEETRGAFGLVLVTSPVFNGAHTTAYALMSFLSRSGKDVLSLEPNVEWPLEGVRQMELRETDPVDQALRSAIAVRPEVLVLFSVPDEATAQLVTQIAPSILLVAVMPAQGAAQALTQFVQMGAPAALLAGALALVTSQRLVREICGECREAAEPPAGQTLAHHGIGAEEAAGLQFFRGRGCPACNKVGYRGRRAIFEVLSATSDLRAAVLDGLEGDDLQAVAAGTGMRTLRERCLDLVKDGVTTFDEFLRLKL
jgi:type II secretory ATPase GspE/PulE/Tfp pilus assembly ATPase PilB-like protein